MSRRRLALAIAALLSVAVVATGCATSAAPGPTMTPTPTSTPTPTETVPASVATPTLPFDGDCTEMLTAAQLDDLLGEGWATYADKLKEWGSGTVRPALRPLGTVGGLSCRWFAPEDAKGGTRSFEVSVGPADTIPDALAADFVEPRCDWSYDTWLCRLARIEGDAWLMAKVSDDPEEVPAELLESTLDAVASGLPVPLGAEAVTPDGWLDIPPCVELGERVHIEDLIGEEYDTGFWEGREQPEMAALREAGVAIHCEWSTGTGRRAPDGEFYLSGMDIVNGGHWQWNEIAGFDRTEDVEVAGAQHAVLYPVGGDVPTDRLDLFATDGVNVIKVNGGDRDFVTTFAERALAALR